MTPYKHWQAPVSAVLGLWLAVSPWMLGFHSDVAAMPNAVIAGLAIFAIALAASFRPQFWQPWASLLLGAWLAASPWALDFAFLNEAKLGAVVVGILVAALEAGVLFTEKDYIGGWRDGGKTA
jgi:hypothetical protein